MEWRPTSLCVLVLALTWGLQVNAIRVRRSNHLDNVCSMWGNFHFKTFDGDVYQFQGICEYNLVSHCHGSVQDFSVHVKRSEFTGDSKINRVLVTIGDMAIKLTKNLVMVNDDVVKLPHYVAGVLLEQYATYIKLYAKLGLSVMWNKDDAVMVELEAKYTNQTCGLCGDFNGMAILNEFISEAREIGPIEFGNKHRIHNPNSQCEDLYEEDEPSTPGKCQAFRPGCSELLEDKAWKSCTSIVSPEPYIQACVVDRCWSRPGDIEDSLPLCTTLSEYSRQCSHAGGTPPNWRKPDFCAVKCPYNMEYSESGSPCVDTCSHTDTSLLCEEHKMDGCYCPPGTVFDDISDRGCIPQEQCQCKHNKVYNSGDVLHMEDKECVCHHGSWTCESLPTPGLCAVEEGSHFTTFDGKEFTFHGECYYILSQDCEESKFTVLGQLIPCVDHETDTCLKSVVLLPNNDKNNALVIKDDGTVKQNGDLTLPYASANIIVFRPSSFHIIVQTSFGLRMQVQLVPVMQLYITLDRSYQTKTCGLCGNFNMVLSDELKTPQGLVEGTASSFANSWKAQSNCRDRSESLDDPCSYNIDSESYAEHWCSKLLEKEGPFAKCHSSVNPESYYKRCKYSTCTCEKTENCLCGVFSSYVRACTAKGIFLQGWRDTVCKKYTEHCPATQTFSYKLQGCQRTCDSLSLERPACINTYLPVDGCACPDGLYENENGVCVALDKCSCYHNGERIKPGKSITIKNEHCVCTNGKLHCHSWKPSVMDCPAPKVFFNCSEAGPEEHGLECAKTCAQKTVDCFLTGCTSGCQCPSGLLDDGRGHCVPQHNCPCKHNGHYYPPGSQITDQCNTCTCKQGKWKCTEEKCPGTCTIYGSGHYNTFDNRRFGFSGDCGYIAAQNKCGNKTGTFHVITENVPCGTTGTTCSKSVRIVLGKTQLDLIDGKVTNTDLESGTLIKYRVRNVGLYLAIEADIGLTVLWDRKTTVRIILQPQHMGEVCGLCGNFNGNGKDDFTTQGQLQVSDVLEFANSWKVNSHCPDAVPDFDPCSKAHNRHTWAKMQCSIITGKTFKECHSMVDPAPYFDNCVRDSCACDTGGDCECFCTAVAAYAQACNEAGVCVAWRTPEICPVFCEFYNDPLECLWHYSPCHTPCYKTCLNPDGICRNPLPNLEGCYPTCPEDKPIFDEEKKICVEKCEGCFINGTEYETGEEIPSDKPCTLCFCDEHGRATCSPREGCCFYNGTEYGDTDVIYNVTDNMGMCYYAICINSTVIETSEPCRTTPSTTPEPTTTFTTSTTEVSTTEVTSTTTITTTTPTPTSTTQTLPTPTVSQETTPCIICDWTEWFNVYDPVTGKGNDLETYENIRDAGKTICETPEDIECKAVSNPDMSLDEFVQETGQVVHCNVSFGLVCKKDDQENSPYKCLDYTIRALCCRPCESTPSPTTTITTPKETTTSQTTPYPGSEGTTPTTTRGTTTPEVITEPTTPHPEPTPSSTTKTTTPEIEQTTTPGTTTKATTTTEVITEPTTPYPEPTPSSTTKTTTPEIEQTTTPGTTTKATTTTEVITEPTTPHPEPTPSSTTKTTTPEIEQTTTPGTTTKATTTTEVITEPTTPHPEPTPSSTTTTTTTTTPEIEQTTTPGTTTKATTTTEVITEPTTPHPGTTPSSTPTTTTTTTTTTTGTSPTSRVPSTTVCVCVINGVHYEPGETIFDMVHIGSGICLTMICSGVCEIKNKTVPCPTPTSSTTPNYDCPTWEVNQNETFEICNCTMARCIEDNIIEIIPYECPPLKNITCSNGKKPVLVWDENYCCEEYACDCFCEGWGDPHYKTFDGHFYSHQGNCTYVLMEEIRPKHNLKIYIDNVNCDPREFVSCPRALIVSYNGVVITLRNNNLIGAAKLEALFGHTSLKLPFAKNGLRVLGTGVKMIVEIPQLEAVLAFGVTGFSVNLPFRHFGENTQGHCGTCNNNKNDDCMLPGGKLIDDCAVMADYWPAKDLYNPDCPQPPTVPPTSAPTKKPCPANPVCELLKTDLFKECHPYVSPDNYFTGCQFDSCHVTNPAVVCTSLQTYASACSQFGICLHWRNHTNLCTVSCEGNKVYKPCGPAEPPTCQDKPDGQSMNVTTEGCFCPDGTMLFNKDSGVCVDKCGCLDPSGQARELGEKFEHNCQDCICEAATASVTCQPKQCSNSNPVICNEPGFIVANETDPTDECCTIFTCRCDSSLCPSVDGKCNIGYAPVLTVPEGKCCPELRCDPKKVCVHKNIEYEPGTTTPVVDCQECHCTWEVDPNSKLYKIRCGMVTCNEDCEPGFEYIEPLGEECCGKCVQTKCVIGHNGTRHVLQVGAEWVPRKPGCDRFICANIGGEFIPTNYKIQCPPFNIDDCQPGTVQLSADGCCQVCVEKERGCKVETTSDYISDNDCWSESRVEQTYCEGDCNSYSKYSELGSSSCSCCQASRTSNRVVTLNCANGVSVKHTYTYVEECSCNQTECQATKQSAETKS
ncbi:mucin-2-like isoform X2 [Astyanax mexicanus]|uniref:mucin-2-like isoform X2 n=1 Tax=Astyanax mexicanus TaxID=7994 RepID=UPI0020CB1BC6|nr:mucin-2-like isoform X2 [Astyanax mexicanus]